MRLDRTEVYEIPEYAGSSSVIQASTQSISAGHINFVYAEDITSGVVLLEQIGDRHLNRRLALTINYEREFVFVENQEFNLWGEGKTLDQAIEDFEDFFLHDLEAYLRTPPDMMDFYARQRLKLYHELI